MDHLPTAQHRPRSRVKSQSRTRARIEGKKNYVLGIGLLLIVVVLWTAGNFITQDLYEDGYEKPFLVTYLNTSAFALYLLPFAIRKSLERNNGAIRSSGYDEYEPLAADVDAAEVLAALDPAEEFTSRTTDLAPLTTKETIKLAAFFCFLWFVANWTVNASLDYTSVASATILSSMSGFFTLAIGRIFRVESLTLVKFATVVTSFGGVVLVSLSDSTQQPPSPSPSVNPLRHTPITTFASAHLLGDFLALFSALFYALYVTLLKVRIRSESRIDMQKFFGFVGLFNILGCWPIGIILHFTGVERFEWPYTSKAIVALLINMAITLSSDYIYVLAMLKTTPLVVTIGLSLTMPLAVLGDFFLAKPAKAQVVVGAAVVLCSFILVGLEDARTVDDDGLSVRGRLHEGQAESGVLLEEDLVPESDSTEGS